MADLAAIPTLITGRTFEEMVPGTVFKTASRTITEADLVAFVTLCGFNEPLFFDAGHAASAGYPGRLVPGALIYCIAEGLTLQSGVLTGTGIAFLSMALDVKRPTFVGDTLTAVVEITASRPTSRGDRGIVESTITVYNQRAEEVLIFTPVRMIRGRDYPASSAP